MELLLCALQGLLSCDLDDVLASCELLLAFLQSSLLATIQSLLSRVKVLLRSLQGLLSTDALVGQSGLLGAVELSLRSLEVLSQLGLLSRKRLGAGLQTKLILRIGIELAASVDGLLIGQGPVGVGRCVGIGDWDRLLQHGSHASALSHGAVDQAPRGHALAGLCASQLHELAVFG